MSSIHSCVNFLAVINEFDNGARSRKMMCVGIYSSLGMPIESFQTSSRDSYVIEAGWTRSDDLIVVTSSGKVLMWVRDQGNLLETSILAADATESIIEAFISADGGLLALTSDNTFLKVDSCKDFGVQDVFQFCRPDFLEFNSPQCWCPSQNESILLAHQSSVYLLNVNDELLCKKLPYGHVCKLAINGMKAAFLTADARLVVTSADLERVLLDMDVGNWLDPLAVTTMIWVTESVIMLFEEISQKLSLIGDDGERFGLKLKSEGKMFILSDADAVRIISTSMHKVIYPMPYNLQELQTAPLRSSKLLSAFDRFTDPTKAPELAMLSDTQLLEDVECCSKALIDWSSEAELAKNLVAAIQKGLHMLSKRLEWDENAKQTLIYIQALASKQITTSEVLSKLQKSSAIIGPQLAVVSKELLLRRMYSRNFHFEAMEIALHLDLDISSILMDWASKKVSKI